MKIEGSGFGSHSQRHGSADPDPHQNVMDPEHWCVPYLQSFLEDGEVGSDELLKLGPIHIPAHINVVHEALNVQGDVVRRGGHQLLQLRTKIHNIEN
jgi:hypothetical protein